MKAKLEFVAVCVKVSIDRSIYKGMLVSIMNIKGDWIVANSITGTSWKITTEELNEHFELYKTERVEL